MNSEIDLGSGGENSYCTDVMWPFVCPSGE
jgi:hypothetical protein